MGRPTSSRTTGRRPSGPCPVRRPRSEVSHYGTRTVSRRAPYPHREGGFDETGRFEHVTVEERTSQRPDSHRVKNGHLPPGFAPASLHWHSVSLSPTRGHPVPRGGSRASKRLRLTLEHFAEHLRGEGFAKQVVLASRLELRLDGQAPSAPLARILSKSTEGAFLFGMIVGRAQVDRK